LLIFSSKALLFDMENLLKIIIHGRYFNYIVKQRIRL
jgi:hypothetical protein